MAARSITEWHLDSNAGPVCWREEALAVESIRSDISEQFFILFTSITCLGNKWVFTAFPYVRT